MFHFRKLHWNIENVIMFTINHFYLNENLAINNPNIIDMLLTKSNQVNNERSMCSTKYKLKTNSKYVYRIYTPIFF